MLSGLKFAGATDTAKLLHVLALCYAADNLTDGFITESAARKLTMARSRDFEKAVEHLTTVQPGCTNPSWEEPNSDQREPNRVWFLHDYDDPLYGNPMKADLATRRVQKAEAGRQGGKKSAEVRTKKYGTARPLSSPHEAQPEAGATKQPEAPASESASPPEPPIPKLSPEADAKLARAQPFPSLPLHTLQEEHGDTVTVGTNGAASRPSPSVQVGRLIDWLCVKHGWSTLSPAMFRQQEGAALKIVALEIPRGDLFAQLDQMWQATDPDDRPTSLAYFWTRLQDDAHAHLKADRGSHVGTSEPSRLDVSSIPIKRAPSTRSESGEASR